MNGIELKRKALERYFGHLNPQQREAVFAVNGAVLILAGAGSGKTTVLVNRIAYMIMFGNAYNEENEVSFTPEQIDLLENFEPEAEGTAQALAAVIGSQPIRPWSILAITFTNKAARELKERIVRMLGDEQGTQVNASTFHSACVRILRREIDLLGYGKGFTIYDADDSKRLLKACIDDKKLAQREFPVNYIASIISNAKDKLTSPEEFADDAEGDYRMEKIAELYSEYQRRLYAANALDFDDIIMKTVELFENNPDVLDHYSNLYRYIMVDEYQDTNYAQYRLISLLAAKYRNLCVVGDDDQSIYRFRGATVENILSFESEFTDCTTIKLEQNYRSKQHILDGANSVIANNGARHEKNLWSDRGEGEKIFICRNDNEQQEAMTVRTVMKRLIDEEDLNWSDFAVLYRMNAQSNSFEREFSLHAVPYKVVGGLRFYDRKEIRDMIAYLTMLTNENDIVRFSRIINEPKRNIGQATVDKINEIAINLNMSPLEVMRRSDSYAPLAKKSKLLKETAEMFDRLREFSEENTPDLLIDEIMNVSGYKQMLDNDGETGVTRLENIAELKTNIVRYMTEKLENEEQPTLEGFMEEIALYAEPEDKTEERDTVNLMTIHTAKGLEFPVVFVVGVENGIFPSERSIAVPSDMEEERRLCYVAMTRAKDRLYLTYANTRLLFGRTQYNERSKFIDEIDPDNTQTFSLLERKAVSSSNSKAIPAKSYVRHGNTELEKISAGDRVASPKFGEGTVLTCKPMGGDALLEISFDTIGTKKLMAKFANIKVIKD